MTPHASRRRRGSVASIFDMDGLLLDSEVLWHEAEIEILGALGVPLSADGCRTTKGMFVNEVTRHWFALYPWAGPTPDELAVTIVDRVIELILTKGTLKPGADHAIDLCAGRGLPLAVASSSEYRLIDAALLHFGLRGRFAVIHSAEEEQYGKPHPAVFLTAAAAVGRAPKRCLVWEDAPAGVLAAKAASMACIAVPEAGEGHHPAVRAGRSGRRLAARGGRRRAGRRGYGVGAGAVSCAGGGRLYRCRSEQRLEARRDLAIAGDGNEVHSVEGARVPDGRSPGRRPGRRRRCGRARGARRGRAGRVTPGMSRVRAMPALATTRTPA